MQNNRKFGWIVEEKIFDSKQLRGYLKSIN
jgi:hypothetical protein